MITNLHTLCNSPHKQLTHCINWIPTTNTKDIKDENYKNIFTGISPRRLLVLILLILKGYWDTPDLRILRFFFFKWRYIYIEKRVHTTNPA